jgi:hypothetical protein
VEGTPPAELLAKPKAVYGRHIGYSFKPVEVQGAEWVRFGFAPYGEARGAGFCMCEGVGFDVDAFGRVFYPNLGQFRIEVVDTANNWVGTFGKYGTADDGGTRGDSASPGVAKPGFAEQGVRGAGREETGQAAGSAPRPSSLAPRPIPLAWPTYVAVDDDYAFVNDTVSNRVVRVKLGAAAEGACELK